jgi:hypothetical protein
MSLPPATGCIACCDCPSPGVAYLSGAAVSPSTVPPADPDTEEYCTSLDAITAAEEAITVYDITTGDETYYAWEETGGGDPPCDFVANAGVIDTATSMLSLSVLMPGRTYKVCFVVTGYFNTVTGTRPFARIAVIQTGNFTFTASSSTESVSLDDVGVDLSWATLVAAAMVSTECECYISAVFTTICDGSDCPTS